jgi:hypothetical protein
LVAIPYGFLAAVQNVLDAMGISAALGEQRAHGHDRGGFADQVF